MSASTAEPATPRLIAGMPRAATTWLCRCFNEHPDTAAFGETLYWGRGYLEPRGANGRYTPEQVRTILDRLATGECVTSVIGARGGSLRNVTFKNITETLEPVRDLVPAEPTPGELFLAVCQAIREAEGKAITVEKTPHHINWLDRIMSAMPHVRVAVLVRDPYSFMLSYKHQGDRKREHVRKDFERRYHPMACALVWRACMRAARDAAARFPKQILLIDNDEIRSNPAHVLERVQECFELPHTVSGSDIAAKVKPENTSFPEQDGQAAARPELRGEDVFWMNLVAGRTITAAGYARRSVTGEYARIAWSFFRLPAWAAWNLFSLKGRVSGSLVAYLWRWLHSPRRNTESLIAAHAQPMETADERK